MSQMILRGYVTLPGLKDLGGGMTCPLSRYLLSITLLKVPKSQKYKGDAQTLSMVTVCNIYPHY